LINYNNSIILIFGTIIKKELNETLVSKLKKQKEFYKRKIK
jgi:hypothetical protein